MFSTAGIISVWRRGSLQAEGGRHYLPIGLVGLDDAKGLALIELPHESDAVSVDSGYANPTFGKSPRRSHDPFRS